MPGMRRLIAATLFSLSAGAHAWDLGAVYGEGNHVGIYGVEARTGQWRSWQWGQHWRLSAHGMASVGYWRAREESQYKELWDFGIAPVLRLERIREGVVPYFEASIGAHWLSARQINGNRAFSTSFQFGEYVAAGLAFGARKQWSADLRLHHVSNGGVENPNPGLTYTAVGLRYAF